MFGNFELARSYGAAKYKVQVAQWTDPATEPVDGDFEDLLDSWGNYLWDSLEGEFVYRVIAPDEENKYMIPSASEYWYLDDLLIEWDTGRFSDGKYSLRLKAYNGGGSEMGIPEELNRLVLVVDNSEPSVSIDEIIFDGQVVDTCGIVSMLPEDELEFVLTVDDADGHLFSYNLKANWGDNSAFSIAGETYDPDIHGSSWTGLSGDSFFYDTWPATCAYNFRLVVWDRVINGYNRIHYTEYNKNITLILE